MRIHSRYTRLRLDPVRRPRWWPRALIVVLLLVAAAGLLYTAAGTPDRDGCATGPDARRTGGLSPHINAAGDSGEYQ